MQLLPMLHVDILRPVRNPMPDIKVGFPPSIWPPDLAGRNAAGVLDLYHPLGAPVGVSAGVVHEAGFGSPAISVLVAAWSPYLVSLSHLAASSVVPPHLYRAASLAGRFLLPHLIAHNFLQNWSGILHVERRRSDVAIVVGHDPSRIHCRRRVGHGFGSSCYDMRQKGGFEAGCLERNMRTEWFLLVEKVDGGYGLDLGMDVWPFVVDDTTHNRIDFDDIEGNLGQELTSADASQTMIMVIARKTKLSASTTCHEGSWLAYMPA
ncbi:hypothetical protein BKA56DRAFT_573033 [Ilyonectria sp. MPI-CAGE-AT-0026]|nr:hypothetical protein BKA56DRAFT_573033 [Ilyonectria sp. MPI-CAGE-AT-0026]